MVGFSRKAKLLQMVCAVVVIVLAHGQARSAEDVGYAVADSSQTSQLDESADKNPSIAPSELLTTAPSPARTWTIDYRFKSFCNSQTSYEVGTPNPPSQGGWAPLSKLRFPLDSCWNGLQVGVEKPNWGVHFEWLTPISRQINGQLADYDWNPPNADGSFTDLGYMRQRWTDGQTITLDLEHKLCDRFFGLPIEVWPIGGFRWQRFDLMAYDLDQVKYENQWTDIHIDGDIISFNQQYYICYVGGQLRKTINFTDKREVRLTFQGDWGASWGFSTDHHLLGDYFAMQADQGSSWHLAFIAEVPMNQWLSLGVQADYLKIRGTGKTWEVGRSPNAWTNGVTSYSDQTSLTAFLRLNY